ncbi:MAG: hypothetical protein WAM82_22620 [Thermoanaerobaculia bacterium]
MADKPKNALLSEPWVRIWPPVVVVLIVGVPGWLAWPHLWAWLNSGHGEVAYRLTYDAALIAVLLQFIRPWLPIRVTPISEPGPVARLTVRNSGRDGNFYATAEILDVRQPDEEKGFQRLTMTPTWGTVDASRAGIVQHGAKELFLAKSWLSDRDWNGKTVNIQLTDEDRYKIVGFTYSPGYGVIEIDLKVTISRAETRTFIRVFHVPGPYVNRFTIKGDEAGRLAVFATPRGRKKRAVSSPELPPAVPSATTASE